jgi:hypothetical protein
MEKNRDDIIASDPDDRSRNTLRNRANLPFYERSIAQMRIDDERLATISFEDWLANTHEIMAGGCHFRYVIHSSEVLDSLPEEIK